MNYPSGEEKKNVTAECILVSYDNSIGHDRSIMIVGRQHKNKPVEILNAFQDEEADELWRKLLTKKEYLKNENV